MHSRLFTNTLRFYSSNSAQGAHGMREKLLDLSLKNVKAHGWTEKSVILACEELGLSPMAYNIGFSHGIGLIDYFFAKSLQTTIKVADTPDFPIEFKDRVQFLSKVRLEQTIPYAEQWQEAVSILAQPQNIKTGLSALSKLSNQIWHLSGDKSYSMDWYFKRGLLMKAYSVTELYMTQDKSPNHRNTFDFMSTNIDYIFAGDKIIDSVVGRAKYFSKNAYNSLASKGIVG